MKPSQGRIYRPELDGLRSIAVLAVVFYHFATPGFGGGFVGVDIFFVLSGFFIARLLWVELSQTGNIQYFNFLFRRLRRLAPAYFLMMIVVSAIAYQVLLPFEYRFFGKELISSTVYLSNILYFREEGYFDIGADSKNLLHTWSLSVEEQFYIFLPLVMLLLSRWMQSLFWPMAFLFVTSLVACVLVTEVSQTTTFFLFPFRAWELLAGVLLAIHGERRGVSWTVHSTVSWLGTALILGSIILMPPGGGFPGALALFPVLGTALLIINGREDNVINRILSHRVPVFFGLISYSLYLWHWPLLTLSKYISDGDLTTFDRAALICVAVVLAWFSWRFVETPFRRGSVSGKVLLSGAAIASALTFGTGGIIYLKDGAPGRFPDDIRMHVDAAGDFLQDWSRCETPATGPWAGIELCPIGPDGPPRILIWGDSHTRAFKEGLEMAAWEADVPALIIWRAGCPPLLGVGKDEDTATPVQNEACAQANAQIGTAVSELEMVDTLLLIGRWAYYVKGTGVGRDADINISVFSSRDSLDSSMTQTQVMANAFAHSTETLSARFDQIAVLRQVPEIALYSARDTARRLAHGHLDTSKGLTEIARAAAERRSQSADDILAGLPQSVKVLDPWPMFCDQEICSAIHDGRSDYFDNNHITNSGARRVRHLFDTLFHDAPEAKLDDTQ
jgi:peptidoglycan/LPS O-acetylase OafA/YrhL